MVVFAIIAHSNGIPLIHQQYRGFHLDIEVPLLGGFLSAIQTFGAMFGPGSQLTDLGLENIRLYLDFREDFLVGMGFDSDIRRKEGTRICTLIADSFQEQYGKTLSNWNGDISIFHEFKNTLSRILGEEGVEQEEFQVEKILEDLNMEVIEPQEAAKRLWEIFLNSVRMRSLNRTDT